MCGPIFDETSKIGQSKMQQEAPANRQFQASRGYVQPPPMPKGIAHHQVNPVMPARTRAALVPA